MRTYVGIDTNLQTIIFFMYVSYSFRKYYKTYIPWEKKLNIIIKKLLFFAFYIAHYLCSRSKLLMGFIYIYVYISTSKREYAKIERLYV